MRLRAKLLAAPVLTAAVALGAAAGHSWLTDRRAAAERAALTEDIEDYKTLGQAQAQIGALHAGVYRTLAILNSLDDKATKAFVADVTNQVDGVKRTLETIAGERTTDEALKKLIAPLPATAGQYGAQVKKAIDLTSVDTNMGVAAMAAAEKSFVQLAKGMHEVVARTEAAYHERQARSAGEGRTSALLFAALALAATAAALAGAWVMQRRLMADLGRVMNLSERVTAGDLTATADTGRRDEVGDLVRSLGAMVVRLRESMQTVQQASASVAAASHEIAAGNIDLSQRTEQTSSNLQQAASSIEQLTGTVTQSADSARQANQLADSAAAVARRGGEVVSQVVSTMDEINQSSRKIADIIGTIDGIAFQTNILALNAAVEAARAGEQGRGFAVVAGEVRSLAQRSAEAAKEIKSLIGASVDRVEAGARLVQDAGTTMNEIVASVQRVNDIIAEISAAASEQSGGIGLVNRSVSQLDQMTQQNAALVEESAAAAESLKSQSERLASVVNRFVLGQAGAATAGY